MDVPYRSCCQYPLINYPEKSKDKKNAENYRRKLEEQDRRESLQLNFLSGSGDDNVFKSEQVSILFV